MSIGLIIISIGIFNGLMLSLIFLRKKDHNFFLGLFILAHCLVLLKYFNTYSLSLEEIFPINTTGNVIEWATAPLIYFYIRKYNNKQIQASWLHFVPLTIIAIIYWVSSKQPDSAGLLFQVIISLKVFQGMGYFYFSFLEAKGNDWLKMISLLFLTEIISVGIYDLQLVLVEPVISDLFIPIVVIIILNTIAFSSIIKSTLFSAEHSKKSDRRDQIIIEKTFNTIKDHLENSKRYLSPNLKLSDLSKDLGKSEKLISQAINDCTGENVNLFINRFRIKMAESLLMDEEFSNITIDGIAEMSGFSNKVSFYKAFKRIHGISPGEFIEARTTEK